MAEFDQRLKGGRFPDLPSLPGEEFSGEVPDFVQPETRHRDVISRAPAQPDIVPPENRQPVPVKQASLEPTSGKHREIASRPQSKTPPPVALAPEPDHPRIMEISPAAATEPRRSRIRKNQVEERDPSNLRGIAPEKPPIDESPRTQRVALAKPEAPRPTPIILPVGLGNELQLSERTDSMPKAEEPQAADAPAKPPVDPELNGNTETSPTPIPAATVPRPADLLPPPPALPEAQPRSEHVTERIIREVSVEKSDNQSQQRESMTAESVSKIGPLPQRQRAFTLFGRRIR